MAWSLRTWLQGLRSRKLEMSKFAALRRYTFLTNALAIVLCSYFVADFLSTAATPFIPEPKAPAPLQSSRTTQKNIAQYNAIFTRNLFNERGLIPDTDDMGTDGGPPVKTSLPLNLLGVIVVTDELKSVASVEDRGSNSVVAVRVNDLINPEALVQKIEQTKLIFFNKGTGRREFIDLPQDVMSLSTRSAKGAGGAIQQVSETHFLIPKAEVDKALTNINEILTQARCVPNFENGRPAGYRCFQIVPGSIYEKLGLKENDVICGLNGQPVNDPGRAFEVFNQLRSLNQIEICINRNGQVLNYVHDIH